MRDTHEARHPWYGPCDALRTDGSCTECHEITLVPGYAEAKGAWWADMQARSAVDEARRAGKRARKAARAPR
jgi:hypothetical protein